MLKNHMATKISNLHFQCTQPIKAEITVCFVAVKKKYGILKYSHAGLPRCLLLQKCSSAFINTTQYMIITKLTAQLYTGLLLAVMSLIMSLLNTVGNVHICHYTVLVGACTEVTKDKNCAR